MLFGENDVSSDFALLQIIITVITYRFSLQESSAA